MDPTNPSFALSTVTDIPCEQSTNGAPNLKQDSSTKERTKFYLLHAVAEKWQHLKRKKGKILPLDEKLDGILIGSKCPKANKPKEVISGKTEDPCAVLIFIVVRSRTN